MLTCGKLHVMCNPCQHICLSWRKRINSAACRWLLEKLSCTQKGKMYIVLTVNSVSPTRPPTLANKKWPNKRKSELPCFTHNYIDLCYMEMYLTMDNSNSRLQEVTEYLVTVVYIYVNTLKRSRKMQSWID